MYINKAKETCQDVADRAKTGIVMNCNRSSNCSVSQVLPSGLKGFGCPSLLHSSGSGEYIMEGFNFLHMES